MESLSKIIEDGKLKTYHFGTSFIEVYWEHEELETGSYYLFMFSTANQKLLEVKKVKPKYLPVKRRAKQMNPLVLSMMESLRS